MRPLTGDNEVLRLSGGKMAQHNSHGVPDDAWTRSVDWVLRALVVVVVVLAYLAWLGRSPIPALLFACAVVVLVRAWHRVPWATDDRHDAAKAGRPRATQIRDVDLMTSREFQQLIARLMRRDSFIGVQSTGLRDDLSTDVLARTPTGQRVVVHCNRYASHRRVGTSDVQRFLGTVHDDYAADIAVLVTTGRFTPSALALAERCDLVLLDRAQLAAWLTGRTTRLTPYLTATS